MTAPASHPEPFGIATIASDLSVARDFYTKLFPYEVVDGVFAGIRYISIMKDGNTLLTAFERSSANPITGTIPVLKVDSVGAYSTFLQSVGSNVIIPESTCPCTMTSFALCADKEGNQFIIKEARN